MTFDEAKLRTLVEKHWHYHGSCDLIDFDFYQTQLGIWLCSASPSVKEFDGLNYVCSFTFNLGRFLMESEVEYEVLSIESHDPVEMSKPCVQIRGRFDGSLFVLSIKTEPDPKETVPF